MESRSCHSLLSVTLDEIVDNKRLAFAWVAERYGIRMLERLKHANQNVPLNTPENERLQVNTLINNLAVTNE